MLERSDECMPSSSPLAMRRKRDSWNAITAQLDADERSRAQRRAGAGALVASLGALLLAAWLVPTSPVPTVKSEAQASIQDPASAASRVIVRSETPAAPVRIEVVQGPDHPVTIESLDDEALLAELDRAGYQRSLTRIGDLVRVLISGRAGSR